MNSWMRSDWEGGKILGVSKGIRKKNQQKAVLCGEYLKEEQITANLIGERLKISWVTY
jgi:hypothetical protein